MDVARYISLCTNYAGPFYVFSHFCILVTVVVVAFFTQIPRRCVMSFRSAIERERQVRDLIFVIQDTWNKIDITRHVSQQISVKLLRHFSELPRTNTHTRAHTHTHIADARGNTTR